MTRRLPDGGSTAVAIVVALVTWWLNSQDASTSADDPAPAPTSAYTSSAPAQATTTPTAPASTTWRASATASPPSGGMPATDPASGLPYVALEDLPPEAAETVHLIDSGGPFPYDKDGSTFGNYEGLLPDEPVGYYKEYTVDTPGSYDRGARRIIAGEDGQLYWTEDHYESFEVIWRATPRE